MHVASGWYPDPSWPGTERYWNGNEWTEDRRPSVADLPEGVAGAAVRSTVGFELPSREALAQLGAGATSGATAGATAGASEGTPGGEAARAGEMRQRTIPVGPGPVVEC